VSAERTILNDCCEDWVVQWGGFYGPGTAFACPECATEWRKTREATYERTSDRRAFARRVRKGREDEFPYLAAVDGQEPIVERCCAKILLTHGAHMPEGAFACPVCSTRWMKRTDRLHGLRVAVFEKPGLAEPLTIQPGRTRPFLIALSEYSPPRD
jgi:predicted RNA-binding Zn-ribbon protein involved in translation (DUF1610 family)